MKPLVLASRSTNRTRILRREGVVFDAIEALIDDAAEAPEGAVDVNSVMIAQSKAYSVFKTFPERCQGKVILAADTMCEMDGRPIGKPLTREEASDMLELAMNAPHRVVTGVCILHQGTPWTFFDQAQVTIDAVSRLELDKYVESELWRGRAGGYDFGERLKHGWGMRCDGDPDTVAGLPWRRARDIILRVERGDP